MALLDKSLDNFASDVLSKYDMFMEDLVMKMTWEMEQWINNAEANSKLHYFIKYTKYWFQNLKEVDNQNAMVFTLYGNTGKYKPSIVSILKAFKQQVGLKGCIGYSYTKNNNFIVFVFDTKLARENAVRNFRHCDENFVVCSDTCNVGAAMSFKISWLPPDIPLQDISKLLSPFMEITKIEKLVTRIDEEDSMASGTIAGKAKTKPGIKLNIIPHLIFVNGYEALITIANREPICFGCFKVGHIISDCPVPYCRKCKTKIPRNHSCNEKKKRL